MHIHIIAIIIICIIFTCFAFVFSSGTKIEYIRYTGIGTCVITSVSLKSADGLDTWTGSSSVDRIPSKSRGAAGAEVEYVQDVINPRSPSLLIGHVESTSNKFLLLCLDLHHLLFDRISLNHMDTSAGQLYLISKSQYIWVYLLGNQIWFDTVCTIFSSFILLSPALGSVAVPEPKHLHFFQHPMGKYPIKVLFKSKFSSLQLSAFGIHFWPKTHNSIKLSKIKEWDVKSSVKMLYLNF